MTKIVNFDREFGVTRIDLLEAMSMNRQLLQESNEKLLDRMDVEVKSLRNEIQTEVKTLRDEIRRVETRLDAKFDKLMYGIVVSIIVPILLHFLIK